MIVDARKSPGAETARGAVRVRPDDPVREAIALRIPKDATLAVFCA